MENFEEFDSICTVNPEKWKRYVKARKFFSDYAFKHYGTLNETAFSPNEPDAVFLVNVLSVDFYEDSLKEFIEVLEDVDELSFKQSNEDSVLIEVRFKNMWEMIGSNE